MSDIDRRNFLKAAACGLAMLGSVPLLCAAEPGAAAGAGGGPIDAGELKSFDHDGVYDSFARQQRFLLVRADKHLYAIAASCTHKGATLRLRDGQIVCPQHGAKFSNDGMVAKGPARRSLVRFGITVDDNGHVMVDKSKQFPEDKWTDKASFVEIADAAK